MPEGWTKCTDELIAEAERLLPTLLYIDLLADYLGICRTTFQKWMRLGRREAHRRDKGKGPSNDPVRHQYFKFYRVCKKALAKGEMVPLLSIKKASELNWTAASWILERRFPERWGGDKRLIRELEQKIKQLEALLQAANEQQNEDA